jgi:uncharacterized membrane protein YidH (DUF202 family)
MEKTKSFLETLLDASIIVTGATIPAYIWGSFSVEAYFVSFGIAVSALQLSLTSILEANFETGLNLYLYVIIGVFFVGLVAQFWRKYRKARKNARETPWYFKLPIWAVGALGLFIAICFFSAHIGKKRAARIENNPHEFAVSFQLVEGGQTVSDHFLLLFDSDRYFFFKPEEGHTPRVIVYTSSQIKNLQFPPKVRVRK